MHELWIALYIFMLSAFTGFEVISRVPVILHTPLMSGTNFIHGIVLVGSMIVMMNAQTPFEIFVGALGVWLGALNVVGGFAVTDRMLEMFKGGKK
jgi:NAD/NADP transhydrogenase alpha subunit